jgi:CO/xanthine dehydrogenase Mo-binding subunit
VSVKPIQDYLTSDLLDRSVLRLEDAKLLSGGGCFVDHIVLPGMPRAAFAGSSLSHTLIGEVDVSRVRELPVTPARQAATRKRDRSMVT